MGITEDTEHLLKRGDKVTVHGPRTDCTGAFRGVGVTAEGKPRIIVDVPGAAIPFAYEFGEVEAIEVSPQVAGAPQGVRLQ